MTTTAKITQNSEYILDKIQHQLGGTKSKIIERALRELDKNIAFNNFNNAYAQLRSDKKLWAEELKEREELAGTLNDGLEDELVKGKFRE